jgi:hypothetical protein
MNTAQTIAETLDRHLTQRTPMVVFGSAALLLDQNFAPRLTGRITNDIDFIIPARREMAVDADRQFWQALKATNRELEPRQLYITHIFPEREVILTPDWKNHTVELPNDRLHNLQLSRPSMLDLVVSKMGRGDLQDQADVQTMLRLQREVFLVGPSSKTITAAAQRVNVPEIYREIFPRAAAQIISAVRKMELGESANPQIPPPRPGYGFGMRP